jgi:hypothetical protein
MDDPPEPVQPVKLSSQSLQSFWAAFRHGEGSSGEATQQRRSDGSSTGATTMVRAVGF